MIILPSVYWGNIEYMASLLKGGDTCIIDTHEHYIKRSPRNRTEIMTSMGVLPLSVPVVKANRPRIPMCEIRVDYSTKWQHQHTVAILSAYRSSPYFDMVWDDISNIYEKRWDFLIDLNQAILEKSLNLINRPLLAQTSDEYVISKEEDLDLRPKNRESMFSIPEYYQLFSEKYPFAENISFLDLLMVEGPSSIEILKNCTQNTPENI